MHVIIYWLICSDLSPSIEEDDYFVDMVKRSWGMVDEKKKYIRMMNLEVTHSNGHVSKVEIPVFHMI